MLGLQLIHVSKWDPRLQWVKPVVLFGIYREYNINLPYYKHVFPSKNYISKCIPCISIELMISDSDSKNSSQTRTYSNSYSFCTEYSWPLWQWVQENKWLVERYCSDNSILHFQTLLVKCSRVFFSKSLFTVEQPYMLPILYWSYLTCWCPGDLRSQGISRHGIDQISQDIPSRASDEFSLTHITKVDTKLPLTNLVIPQRTITSTPMKVKLLASLTEFCIWSCSWLSILHVNIY